MSAARTESPEKIAKCAEVGRNARRRHDAIAQRFVEVFNARLREMQGPEDASASRPGTAGDIGREHRPSSRSGPGGQR